MIRENSKASDLACHWSTEDPFASATSPPDAVILSLDRLPSHTRAVAEWFQEAKKRRVPMIFAGGQPDKVDTTRAKFPDAIYCATEDLHTTLNETWKSGH